MVNGKWNVHQGIARRMRKEKSVKNVHWSGYAAVQMCIVCVHIRNMYVFVCVCCCTYGIFNSMQRIL